MRFLIDEQLPHLLADVLGSKGHEADHVATLSVDKGPSDEMIIQRCLSEDWILITKDGDFLNSFLLKRKPPKLIYVVTGNIKNKALLTLFRLHLNQLVTFLQSHQVIEVSTVGIRVLH